MTQKTKTKKTKLEFEQHAAICNRHFSLLFEEFQKKTLSTIHIHMLGEVITIGDD
jgi:hypothetical protein